MKRVLRGAQNWEQLLHLKVAAINRDLKRDGIWIHGIMFISQAGYVWDLSFKSRVKEPVSSVFDSVLSYNPKYLSCCFKLNFKSNYKIHLKYLLIITHFLCPIFFVLFAARKMLFSSCFDSGKFPLTLIMHLTINK